MRYRGLLFAVLAASPLLAQRGGQQAPVPQGTTLIKAGKLIDVRGGRVLANQSILVQGDRIAQVGPDISAPVGARVIDLSHSTPG
ncbi:MAG: hypothetical protein WBY44_01625 [Bryobacteraceae bacterium]